MAVKLGTMNASLHNKPKPKTPRQLWVAAAFSIISAAVLVYFGFLALPSLAPEHQAFWSGMIGSFVGSAVAFGGAAWLWRLERHILVEERASDRVEIRLEEQHRGDIRTLRDCLSVIGNLQALNYHMHNEGRFATARDKYLMHIRFDEAMSLIHDEKLRGELEFMSRLAEEDDALDYMIMQEYSRLRTVHQWLLQLIALQDDQEVAGVRPKNYEKLASGLAGYDEYREEQWAAIAEYEEAKQRATQKKPEETEQEA